MGENLNQNLVKYVGMAIINQTKVLMLRGIAKNS